MWNPSKSLLAGGLALTMLATACGDDIDSGQAADADQVTLQPGEFSLTAGLATFDSCDALLTHLRTEGAERVGPWGFNDGGYFFGGDVVMEAAVDMAADDSADFDTGSDGATSPQSTAPAAVEEGGNRLVEGEDFSGTNNQERGVDEPDIVKTDGERILTVTNGTFTYVDAGDGVPVRRGSIMVGYETRDMLVAGDRVLLFGVSYGDGGGPVPMPVEPEIAIAVDEVDAEAEFADDIAVDADILPPGPGGYYGPRVRIVELDLSDPDNLEVAGQLWIDGHYLSARLVDGKVSVALQSNPHDLGFVFPQGEAGEERAEEFNRQIVAETELNDWLPSYTLEAGGSSSGGVLTDCQNVHAPVEFAGFGSLSVVTIDMAEGLTAPESASVLAAGETVYASTDNMWIATNRWIDWGILDDAARIAAEQSYSTQIHGFSIAGDRPTYLASGGVRGHLLNQFAMSEHEGVLRVASTDGTIWGATDQSESFVTTLSIEADEKVLEELGQVGNMGKGERIFSVRFVGDTAYVVTFRQTDPFYTVDLSDPANPRVLGELKITGYSGQLHPLSPTMVLGIGQEATEEGRTTGAKVTLFDVSDLANPIDVDTWTVPNAWTEAEWDHKAFLWWAPENLAVLPVSNWQEQFWGAIAFRVDLDAGTIEEAGRISHEPDRATPVGTTDCTVLDAAELERYRESDSVLAELAWEAEWIVQDGGQVQLCGEGETGASGLFCDRWWGEKIADSEFGEGVLEVCWPEGPGSDPIVRTLVIGDTLWSLSWSRLQANDLGTFAAGEWVELGR